MVKWLFGVHPEPNPRQLEKHWIKLQTNHWHQPQKGPCCNTVRFYSKIIIQTLWNVFCPKVVWFCRVLLCTCTSFIVTRVVFTFQGLVSLLNAFRQGLRISIKYVHELTRTFMNWQGRWTQSAIILSMEMQAVKPVLINVPCGWLKTSHHNNR